MNQKNKPIDGTKLSLEEWLRIILSENYENVTPYVHFPTDDMLDGYLANLNVTPEEEVRLLLSRFLFPSLTTGADKIHAQLHLQQSNENSHRKLLKDGGFTNSDIETRLLNYEVIKKTAYYRRLMNHIEYGSFVWEGITWILDLLPDKPFSAIRALDSYFEANMLILPDQLMQAISDSSVLIRAKYIHYEQKNSIFFDLTPEDFEILVAQLYVEMGYIVKLTKRSHDGGIDIYARKEKIGGVDDFLIQCKRYKKGLGVRAIDEVLGMVTRNKASKCILITSSSFSIYAKKRNLQNPRIELVDGKELSIMLNNFFGPFWPSKIDRIINSYKSKMKSREIIN